MLTYDVGPGARAVTTTCAAPGSLAAGPDLADRRRRLREDTGHAWAFCSQVHSARVVQAGDPGEGDALVTTDPALAPAVRTADCVPITLASESGGVRCAIHAGRVGLLAGVIPAALAAVRARTDEPLYAAIGPQICAGCYEVGADLAERTWEQRPEARARTRWGTPALNLTAIARADLAGVTICEPDPAATWCTHENPDLFSYRRDATAERIATAVLTKHGHAGGAAH